MCSQGHLGYSRCVPASLAAALIWAALLAAADPPPARPPAHLVVPESVRKQRAPAEPPSAQMGFASPEVLAAAGPLQARPGEWAEYLVSEGGTPAMRMRLGVLPPPKDAGEGRYWLEIVTIGGGTLPSAVRMLAHGDPLSLTNVERVLIYVTGQVPLELPLEDASERLEDQRKQTPPPRPARVQRQPAEDVQVHAGRYHAERVRVRAAGGTTRLWLDRDHVPLWGLVRAETGRRVIELFASGREGAHTVFPPAPGEPDERPDAGAPLYGNGSESTK
jgi:hypothetical protein